MKKLLLVILFFNILFGYKTEEILKINLESINIIKNNIIELKENNNFNRLLDEIDKRNVFGELDGKYNVFLYNTILNFLKDLENYINILPYFISGNEINEEHYKNIKIIIEENNNLLNKLYHQNLNQNSYKNMLKILNNLDFCLKELNFIFYISLNNYEVCNFLNDKYKNNYSYYDLLKRIIKINKETIKIYNNNKLY